MKSRVRGNAWPIVTVGAGALFVLGIVPLILHRQHSGRMATVDPHVTIGDTSTNSTATQKVSAHRWPDSEVPRTAERLRDVTAIAIAATATLVEGAMNRRIPRDASTILNDVAQRRLIPTEWLTNQPGVLQMPNGTVHLRYAPQTVSIEVLSVPNDRSDGPAILIRLPDQENTGVGPRYFESMQLDGIVYSSPFAPISVIIASGWQPRLFKQNQLADSERVELERLTKTSLRK